MGTLRIGRIRATADRVRVWGAQGFTLGRSAQTSTTGGRSGDDVTIDGVIATDNLESALTMRDQLVGYMANPDEDVVPITWDADPTVAGFYVITAGSVSVPEQGLARSVLEFSLTCTRINSYAHPQGERVVSGVVLPNAWSSAGSALWNFPTSWRELQCTSLGTIVTTATPTSSGSVDTYTGAFGSKYVQFGGDPDTWYDSPCTLRVGTQVPPDPLSIDQERATSNLAGSSNADTPLDLYSGGVRIGRDCIVADPPPGVGPPYAPTGCYSDISWPINTTFHTYEWTLTPTDTDDGMFWAHQFALTGGVTAYAGLQAHGSDPDPTTLVGDTYSDTYSDTYPGAYVPDEDDTDDGGDAVNPSPKLAILAVFGFANTTGAVPGDIAPPEWATQGPGGEDARNIVAEYAWVSGRTYRLKVTFFGDDLHFYVTDTLTGVQTHIGYMTVSSPSYNALNGGAGGLYFSERFGPAALASNSDINYDTCLFGIPVADGSVSPSMMQNHITTDPAGTTPDTRVSWLEDFSAIRHEMGCNQGGPPSIEVIPSGSEYLPVVGRQVDVEPYGWLLDNGLIRAWPDKAGGRGGLALQRWDGTRWAGWSNRYDYLGVALTWTITGTADRALGSDVCPWRSAVILRNDPEGVVLRLTADVRVGVGWGSNSITVDLRLRRGEPFVRVVCVPDPGLGTNSWVTASGLGVSGTNVAPGTVEGNSDSPAGFRSFIAAAHGTRQPAGNAINGQAGLSEFGIGYLPHTSTTTWSPAYLSGQVEASSAVER